MKIGDNGESFVLVLPDNDGEGFTYCVNPEGEELRAVDKDGALHLIDEAIDSYGGKTVYILKETREVVEEVAVPNIDSEGNFL